MIRLVMLVAALLAPLLQATILYHTPGGAPLDLVLLLTVAVGLLRGPLWGAAAGFGGGLLLGMAVDVLPLSYAAAYCTVGCAAGWMEARSMGQIMLAAAICSLLLGIAECLLLWSAAVVPAFPWHEVVAFVLLSALCEVPALSLVRRGLQRQCRV